MEIPEGDTPFMRTKAMTFTREQKPQHLHKGVLAEIEGLGFSLVLLPNCGSCICGHKTVVQRGGPLSETQKRSEKQFLSRSVLLKLIRFEWMSFSWKIEYRS